MTCIVGFIDDNKDVYMGADSAGTSDNGRITSRKDKKIFLKDDFVIGFTTSFRMGQLLQYKLEIPKQKENQDTFEYMVTDFVEAVREKLKDGGFASKEKDKEEGGVFLVGYRGRLFTIFSDYQVAESIVPYASVGSGSSYALGALYALQKEYLGKPWGKIMIALQAAAANCSSVDKPFNIYSPVNSKTEILTYSSTFNSLS